MQNRLPVFGMWCATVLLALGASACAVIDGEGTDDETAVGEPDSSAHSQGVEVTEGIDACTALLGCIYTANQNGNDWLVPECYRVLGAACAELMQ